MRLSSHPAPSLTERGGDALNPQWYKRYYSYHYSYHRGEYAGSNPPHSQL